MVRAATRLVSRILKKIGFARYENPIDRRETGKLSLDETMVIRTTRSIHDQTIRIRCVVP
jgi:hypothetical protein